MLHAVTSQSGQQPIEQVAHRQFGRDEVDDEACSPEEAQLLLYLGHSLHDYLGDVEEHKHALMKASEQFEGGMF